MLDFDSAHTPRNAILNLELQRSYQALHNDLALRSAMTLSNVCQRDYALTMDAIMKQLPSRNIVSLALDGWTSPSKLSPTSVIAYHVDHNWALHEVQLAIDDVDPLFISRFESKSIMIGQGPTYWSKPSDTFEGGARSF